MLTAQRDFPYIWATWLPRLLTGENSCEWAIWFKAHHQNWIKQPSDFDQSQWLLNHTALLNEQKARFAASQPQRRPSGCQAPKSAGSATSAPPTAPSEWTRAQSPKPAPPPNSKPPVCIIAGPRHFWENARRLNHQDGAISLLQFRGRRAGSQLPNCQWRRQCVPLWRSKTVPRE